MPLSRRESITPYASISLIQTMAVTPWSYSFSFWASNFKEVLVFTLILQVLMWRSLRSPAHAEDD